MFCFSEWTYGERFHNKILEEWLHETLSEISYLKVAKDVTSCYREEICIVS